MDCYIYSVKTYAVGRYVEDSKNSAIRARDFCKKWKVHHQGRNNLPERLNFTIRGRRDVIILKGTSLLPFKTTMLSIKIEKSPISAPDN
jgi:hypothetical protein